MSTMNTMEARNFIGKVYVSQHAIDRASSRFNVDKAKAEQWIRDNVRKARYVSTILSGDGKTSRLFTFQRVAYILAVDSDHVVTVFEQHHAPAELTQRVRKLILAELAKYERKEAVVERTVNVEKSRLAIEIARCNYRMMVTPSKTVIQANTKRLREIENIYAELDAKLTEIRREKTSIAHGLVAYL